MSAKRSASSPSATATAADDQLDRLLFTDGKNRRFGPVNVSDINSPNGVRKTDLFTEKMYGPNGELIAVEAWGLDAKKINDFFL